MREHWLEAALVAALATLCAVGMARALALETERPPLPAVAVPALFAQAPNPDHPGHKMRPDGQACARAGKDPCGCQISHCSKDDHGYVESYSVDSECQWHCDKTRCTCHPCPDGEAACQ